MRPLLTACAVLLVALPASAANPLANPNFDTDLSHWWPVDPGLAASWSPLNANTYPWSGSVRLVNTLATAPGLPAYIQSDCLQVVGGLDYEVSGWAYIPSGQANTGLPYISFERSEDSDCTMSSLFPFSFCTIPFDQWTKCSLKLPVSPEGRSARVHIGSVKLEAGGSFVLNWDAIDFQPVPEPTPTLSEPAVVALALLMLVTAITVARRAEKSRGT